jgi:hypothetical protein
MNLERPHWPATSPSDLSDVAPPHFAWCHSDGETPYARHDRLTIMPFDKSGIWRFEERREARRGQSDAVKLEIVFTPRDEIVNKVCIALSGNQLHKHVRSAIKHLDLPGGKETIQGDHTPCVDCRREEGLHLQRTGWDNRLRGDADIPADRVSIWMVYNGTEEMKMNDESVQNAESTPTSRRLCGTMWAATQAFGSVCVKRQTPSRPMT